MCSLILSICLAVFVLYVVLDLVCILVLWFNRGLLVDTTPGPVLPGDGVTVKSLCSVNQTTLVVVVALLSVQALVAVAAIVLFFVRRRYQSSVVVPGKRTRVRGYDERTPLRF